MTAEKESPVKTQDAGIAFREENTTYAQIVTLYYVVMLFISISTVR